MGDSLQTSMLIRQAREALDRERWDEAESLCAEILAQNRKQLDALSMRGHVASVRGNFEEAESLLRKCSTLAPKDPTCHYQLAQLYRRQGRYRDAIKRFDRMLRLLPDDPGATAGKAYVLEWIGERDKAAALIRPFIDDGTATAEMAVVETKILVRHKAYEEAIAVADRFLEQEDLEPRRRIDLLSLIGKAAERRGDIDRAFDAYRASNSVEPSSFDPQTLVTATDAMIEAFSPDLVARLPRANTASGMMVFIVGTPRSGTTLLERMIDAHPQATGVGETDDVLRLAHGLAFDINSTLEYPACASDLDQADVDRLSRAVFARHARLPGRPQRVADKSVSTFAHLGLASVLFPKAAFIHIRRDPLDTCFSCYAEPLLGENIPWSRDLGHIGVFYRQYERLMEHWYRTLDIRLLEVRYEDLVTDPESAVRHIIEFCRLDWDKACLRYHESKSTARTLSYDQVRQPVYRSAVGRGRRFEKHLGALMNELSM
jgi:tetratricopeptide (TPR) repeat protein